MSEFRNTSDGQYVTRCDCIEVLQHILQWMQPSVCDQARSLASVTVHMLKSHRKRNFYGSFLDH